jgi:hypothetical protein
VDGFLSAAGYRKLNYNSLFNVWIV